MHYLQKAIGEWANATFPNPSHRGRMHHIRKELAELENAPDPRNRSEERADIVILLMHDANEDGDDLLTAVEDKFVVLKTRRWGKPDENGVIEHIRDEEVAA